MVGVTVMIGLNDVSPEVFTLADASTLLSAAQSGGVGFLSFWSTSRDQQCSGSPTISSNCSGVTQSPWAFSNIFNLFTAP
jgi:chitinase